MKIMIDARFYGLEHAGLGRYTINLLKNLIDLDDKNNYQVLLRNKYFKRLKFPKKWQKIKAEFPHYTAKEQLYLKRIVKKYKPDLFHALNPNIPYFYKGNLIVTVHDLTQIRYERKATTHRLPTYTVKLYLYKLIFQKAVSYSKKIIVPTTAVKNDLIDFYNIDEKKVEVIYEGVSKPETISKSSEFVLEKYNLSEKKYIVYTGNAYPHKNLDRAVEALMYVNEKRSEKLYFAIISARDKFTKSIENTIKKHMAQQYVQLLGFVPDEFIEHLYENSVAFIYPSTAEGFGLPGLEAMQTGTLLLASNIPVFREVYGKNAIYFNPYDFTSISEAIEEMLDLNVTAKRKRITKAQKFVTKYSWQKMVYETLGIYDQVLSNK